VYRYYRNIIEKISIIKENYIVKGRNFNETEYSVYFPVLIRKTGGDEVKRVYYTMTETSLRERPNKITITYTNNMHSRKCDNSIVLNK